MHGAICSVVFYDDIDKAIRNTSLRPWEHFSCFTLELCLASDFSPPPTEV